MPLDDNQYTNSHNYSKRIGQQRESSFKWKQIGSEIVYGGFSDKPGTTEGTVASILIGFIPIVGQVVDARDTIAAALEVFKKPKSAAAWGGLGLVLVFWIPGTDALKILKKKKIPKQGSNPFANLSDLEIEDAISQIKPSGAMLDDLIPHNKATKTRKTLRLSGDEYQSMHLAPQSSMNDVDGYNPKVTLTRLGQVDVHKRWDKIWQDAFKAPKYNEVEFVEAQEMFDVVSRAIKSSTDFVTEEKASMVARLWDEIFIETGLSLDSLVKRPHYRKKIKSLK